MKVKKFNKDAILPTRKHRTDAGLDMYLPNDINIYPTETVCIGFGLGFEVPEGYAGIFVPRSSLAKQGLMIGPAIVDCGYTGEVHLIATNTSRVTMCFKKGDRLCSLVLFKIGMPELEEVEEFDETERGDKGLGSSGV